MLKLLFNKNFYLIKIEICVKKFESKISLGLKEKEPNVSTEVNTSVENWDRRNYADSPPF